MTTENDELKIQFEDFDKICRFCYKRSHYMRSIFDGVDEKPDAELFCSFSEQEDDTVNMLFTNLGLKACLFFIIHGNSLHFLFFLPKVHFGDGLPEFMCNNCHENLLQSNKFRKQCYTATDYLNKIRLDHEERQQDLIKKEVLTCEVNERSSCDDFFDVILNLFNVAFN